jgi:hypothetical protein
MANARSMGRGFTWRERFPSPLWARPMATQAIGKADAAAAKLAAADLKAQFAAERAKVAAAVL